MLLRVVFFLFSALAAGLQVRGLAVRARLRSCGTGAGGPRARLTTTGRCAAADSVAGGGGGGELSVLVTGAGSSVGYEVFKKLLARPSKFRPYGLVRNEQDVRKLLKIGAKRESVIVGDILDRQSLVGVFQQNSIDKCVLCTSARPRKTLVCKVKSFFRWIVRRPRSPKVNELYYPSGESPYLVDFIGQRNVIDEAVAASVQHIVLLSNCGGYRASSKVNEIGRSPDDPNSGNLLSWKKSAERYLMKRSFFTIIHAPSLTDEPGGQRTIVWDTDDTLLRTPYKTIPREDLAEVLVSALLIKDAIGRSIDVAARQEGTEATKDWRRFWSLPGSNTYPPLD